MLGSEIQSGRRLHHSEIYPLPPPDYNLGPAKKLTKAQFEGEVTKLSKNKQDKIMEEQRKRCVTYV